MENDTHTRIGIRPMTFAEKESICEFHFRNEGPFWHISTPGMFQEILFITDDDYRFGMSSAAICAAETGVEVYAQTLMGNHIHDIVSCTRQRCLDYLTHRRERLRRYLKKKGRDVDLSSFKCDPIPITSVRMLRNEIVYVHRNGYVAHPEHTPYSYPWGTGAYYFNPLARADSGVPFASLTYKMRREVFQGRIADLPSSFRYKHGIIYPPSFCSIDKGEMMFRDANQYFVLLSRNYEAYSEEARRLGDNLILPDEEMYPAAQMESNKRFGTSKLAGLGLKEKVEMARVMHEDYAATNSQIQRILNLDLTAVNSLYPMSAPRK